MKANLLLFSFVFPMLIIGLNSSVLPLAGKTQEDIALDDEAFKFAENAFRERCSICHEEDGNSANEKLNLVDGVWNNGGKLAEIEKVIREGVPDTKMKPQKKIFSEKEITYLAKYVKLLKLRKKQSRSSLPHLDDPGRGG